jgi:hypothetical protein
MAYHVSRHGVPRFGPALEFGVLSFSLFFFLFILSDMLGGLLSFCSVNTFLVPGQVGSLLF